LIENIPLEMVWVPSDTLIMGSISPEADDDEFPLLTIPLKGFMISPTEITQQQWNMVYSSNPSLYQGAELPVENVSFYDVIEYCNAKSLIDGLTPVYDYRGTEIICDFDADGYRLPTEAEWEFAAKAGIGKNFMLYSGSDDPDEIGWFSENSLARSHIVAGKEPNALDLYDMSGNVYEWVWNWYAPYSYRIGNLYSGPINGTDKVIRGGSWYHNADHLRTTSRDYVKPYVKTGFIGFRVVRSR
jgi:formylglycine-generating enzyme